MKLTDKIRIDASAEEIWPHVGDPERWVDFNSKLASVKQASGSGPSVDSWYDIEFEMNGRKMMHRGRLAEVDPLRRLRMEATCPTPRGEIDVEITYELEPVRGGVQVRERFDIRNHGLPRPLALLIQWFHRWGTVQGPRALENLRELLRPGSARPAN